MKVSQKTNALPSRYPAIVGNNETGTALAQKTLSAIAVGDFVLTKDALSPFTNVPGLNPFPWVVAPSTGYVADQNSGFSYFEDGGTSFAGPYVAGLAALLFQKYPAASAKFIIERIIAGASVPENHRPSNVETPISSEASLIAGNAADENFAFRRRQDGSTQTSSTKNRLATIAVARPGCSCVF